VKIVSATFVQSATGLENAPKFNGLPEWALVGRSNVGKSSFINTMLGRKNLAKTSNTPGKTRLINYYKVNEQYLFVDLPGYGYAKVSKTEQEQWRRNLEKYLSKRKEIQAIVQLIDARHGPQESDLQMFAWLDHHELPVLIVLTKTDKISKNDIANQIHKTAKVLKIEPEYIVPFSAETGLGKDTVWQTLTSL
jgi:GTP-binding protein